MVYCLQKVSFVFLLPSPGICSSTYKMFNNGIYFGRVAFGKEVEKIDIQGSRVTVNHTNVKNKNMLFMLCNRIHKPSQRVLLYNGGTA